MGWNWKGTEMGYSGLKWTEWIIVDWMNKSKPKYYKKVECSKGNIKGCSKGIDLKSIF